MGRVGAVYRRTVSLAIFAPQTLFPMSPFLPSMRAHRQAPTDMASLVCTASSGLRGGHVRITDLLMMRIPKLGFPVLDTSSVEH